MTPLPQFTRTGRLKIPRWPERVFFQAHCDLCGWESIPKFSEAEARTACRSHARARLHREDADAENRARLQEAREILENIREVDAPSGASS